MWIGKRGSELLTLTHCDWGSAEFGTDQLIPTRRQRFHLTTYYCATFAVRTPLPHTLHPTHFTILNRTTRPCVVRVYHVHRTTLPPHTLDFTLHRPACTLLSGLYVGTDGTRDGARSSSTATRQQMPAERHRDATDVSTDKAAVACGTGRAKAGKAARKDASRETATAARSRGRAVAA